MKQSLCLRKVSLHYIFYGNLLHLKCEPKDKCPNRLVEFKNSINFILKMVVLNINNESQLLFY